MRRKDREVTSMERIEALLSSAKFLHLGMFDGDYPYVVPMHYGYTLTDGGLTLYTHCALEGHKLDCLRQNNHVFVGIDREGPAIPGTVACEYGAAYESLMGRGTATILTDEVEKCEALRVLMRTQTGKNFVFTPEMSKAVAVLRINVDAYTAKAREKQP